MGERLTRSRVREGWSRRDLLRTAAAIVALERAPGRAAAQSPKFADYPFALGVASGDPSPDGFVLWTRLAPAPLEGGGMPAEDVAVDWQIAEDEGFERIAAQGSVAAKPELAHAVHVEAQGLAPDRWHFYRFRSGGEISAVGRARTAPAPDQTPERTRLAFASCQHYEQGYFTALRHLADEDLDLVLHLGDYIYEGAARADRVRQHRGAEIETLDDYRNRQALYKTDPDLQAAHQRFPWIVTWDDHEFDNNYAGGLSEEPDIDAQKFLERRTAAYQAYYEHMPLRPAARPRGADMRLYRRLGWGRLIDFAVLDTRQYRSDQPCGDRSGVECPGVFEPDTTILGADQERWLYASLERSPAIWNCLAQQVLVARVDVDPTEKEVYSMDKWASYDEALRRFLRFLDERRPSNPIVLTGDIHSNWVCDLLSDFRRPEEARIVGTEFVGTSITSGGDGSEAADYAAALGRENPHVKFFNRERGYVSCEATADEWRADYRIVPYVSRPGAPVETRASFVVEQGRPGAQRL